MTREKPTQLNNGHVNGQRSRRCPVWEQVQEAETQTPSWGQKLAGCGESLPTSSQGAKASALRHGYSTPGNIL